jgi:inhibitor of cysteine peptidase
MKKLILLFLFAVSVCLTMAQIADPFGNPTVFGSGMNLVARVKINNIDADVNDILAAYAGNQLRAKTSLIAYSSPVTGVGRTFLIQTVTPNETITFKIWDYSEQRIYIASITLSAIPGGTMGSYPNNIYEINANITTYSVYGTVTLNNNPLQGITMNAAAGNPNINLNTYRTLTTNADGAYLVPELRNGASLSLTPNNILYDFTPLNLTIENVLSDQVQNFTAQPAQTYTVSGFVSYNGSPLANVSVSTGSIHALTDLNGYYHLELPQNQNYTLSASKTGWDFSPASIAVNQLQANSSNNNFTATPWKFMIYGSCGTPQTTISISSTLGNIYPSVLSDQNGDYQIPDILYNDTVTLTPAKQGYIFNPISRTFNNVQANTSFSFTASPITYTISGSISENGNPLANVNISCGSQQTTANAAGFYSVTALWHSNPVVIPEKTGYRFTPVQIAYNQIEQNQTANFTAQALQIFTISGTVLKSNNSPLNNCLISVGNVSSFTDINGAYSLSLYESDQPVQISASKTGYTFNPQTITLNNLTQNQINQDFTATPENYTVSGSISGTSSVTVNLTGSVNLQTVTDGSGNYSFSNIPFESNITITPSKNHYSFSPASININQISANQNAQNFSATPANYTVTVTVTDQGSPLSNATVIYNGNTGLTNINGIFTFTLPYNNSCSVSVSKSGYFFVQNEQVIAGIDQDLNLSFLTRAPIIYTISGNVSLNGNAQANVEIIHDNGSVFTDASGNYSISGTEGTTVNLTPQLTGYIFTPASKVFTNLIQNQTQNFISALRPVLYSGFIYYSNLPLANVKIHFLSDSTYTDASGHFSLSIPYFSNTEIRPVHPAYEFSPLSYNIVNASQDQTGLIFNAADKIYHVNGFVSHNGTPLSGVNISSSLNNQSYSSNAQGIYTLPLLYNQSTVLKAAADDYSFSPDSIIVSNISSDLENRDFSASLKCRPVVFSLNSGVYYEAQTVSLSSPTDNSVIYYTLNGQEPTESSSLYQNPIVLSLESYTIVKAKAFRQNYLASETVSRYYNITGTLTNPVCSHASTTYNTAIMVTLSAQNGAQIRYTKNGQEPIETDSLYYSPLYINSPCTLKAKAFRYNYQSSESISRDYNFNHIITLSLPDTLVLNQNESITIYLNNYINDSVSGDRLYSIVLPENSVFALSLNNPYLLIQPQTDWYGENYLRIGAFWNQGQTVYDSMMIKVIPDNYPPYLVSAIPSDSIITVNPPCTKNFIVNAADPDDAVFYRWYLNNILLNETANSVSLDFNNLGEFHLRCEITDLNSTIYRGWQINSVVSSDPLDNQNLKYSLNQNYPNPFNPETTISFSIAKDSKVEIDIFDIRGRLVKKLINADYKKGQHKIVWDARDRFGKTLSNGIYLYKIKAGNFNATRKAVILK